MTAYDQLTRRFARLDALNGAAEVLHWDMATQMPRGGQGARADQLAALHVITHELLTDPRVADLLADADAATDLSEGQRANLREMRHHWRHATAVPADLVEASTRAASDCESFWRVARPANDFKGLAPRLGKVFELARARAEAKSAALGVSLYDAMLDQYEPGGTSARLDVLFADLAGFLPGLIEQVIEKQAAESPVLAADGPFPIEAQRTLGLRIMKVLGFDFDHGRLDVSAHPFCGGTQEDVRITTRYDEKDFVKSLMGVIHETGHALYERGRPAEWRGQPAGQARGMGMHESQSLLMEMQACRTPEFLEFAAPLIREAFGGSGPAFTAENLYRRYTRVQRSLIRVDADEVTYPCHVILRYNLEKSILSGDLRVNDLPGAWNAGMQALVGITPTTDQDGCMQDIHWMDGTLGYFPTYTVGAATAAQLFEQANRVDPQIRPSIARGDFKPLLTWLRANVHQHGSLFATDDLMTRATGRPLDASVFKAHLQRRYLGH